MKPLTVCLALPPAAGVQRCLTAKPTPNAKVAKLVLTVKVSRSAPLGVARTTVTARSGAARGAEAYLLHIAAG